MANKKIRAEVDRLDGSELVLDVGGREVRWPRAALPARVVEGDVLVFDVSVDHAAAARDEVALRIDASSRRVGAASKRGGRNPRTTSTRSTGKK